jgi:hypothetical protein
MCQSGVTGLSAEWNQDNMSEWSNRSICGVLFQGASTNIQVNILFLYKAYVISYQNLTCSHHDIAEKLLTWC